MPSNATFYGGNAYMRFRLSTAGGLNWTGAASNGEVEDYWQPLACVGNYVWYDSNLDGIQNEAGSNGIDGVVMRLTWGGPDGDVSTTGDNLTYNTTTSTVGTLPGRYQFCGLIPRVGSGGAYGTYQIGIPNPGATATLLPGAGSSFLNNDGTQTGGATGPILHRAGGLSWTGAASSGEVEDYWQALACVGNFVWSDTNADGIQNEPGTAGIDGTRVTLTWVGLNGAFGGGDDVVYSTLTSTSGTVSGRYQFCGLMPSVTGAVVGTYRLDIPNPPYTLVTTANSGSTTDYLDSDCTQSGGSGGPVTIPSFTIVSPIGLVIGENGPGDQVGSGTTGIGFSGFPNNQDDMSIDFGFTGIPTAVTLSDLQAAPQSLWEALLTLLRQFAR